MKSRQPLHKTLFECLGQVIQKRRKQLELSQEELSERSGVDRAFISEVERGQRNPSMGAVASLAGGLKMKMSRLMQKAEECMRSSQPGDIESSMNGDEVAASEG